LQKILDNRKPLTWDLFQKLLLGEDEKLGPKIIATNEAELKMLLAELYPESSIGKRGECPLGIKGLLSLFQEEGCFGLNIILEKLQAIKNKHGEESCRQFIHCFLATSENWTELLQKKTLTRMDRLLSLQPNQLKWWEALTTQHVALTHSANLDDLLDGFIYFYSTYEVITGQSLPPDCPLQLVDHMKVGLDRLLDILRNAKNSNHLKEQLEALKLDLGPEANHHALQEGYHLVTSEMKFNEMLPHTLPLPEEENKPDFWREVTNVKTASVEDRLVPGESRYTYSRTDPAITAITKLFHTKHGSERKLYTQAITDFQSKYNKNRTGKSRSPFMQDTIYSLPWLRIQINFILILDHTTSHTRAQARNKAEYISQHTNDLAKILVELKEEGCEGDYYDKFQRLREKIPNAQRISHCLAVWDNSTPRITLEEAVAIARLLSEYRGREIHSVNYQIRAVVHLYKGHFLKRLTAWHKDDLRIPASEFLKQFNPYRVDASLLTNLANDQDINYQEMQVYFYRYLGRQQFFAPYQTYKPALDLVAASKLHESTKKKVLTLLALTSMHLRGCRTDVITAVQTFLPQLQSQNPTIANQLLDYLLSWQTTTPRINFAEAAAVLATLQEYKSDIQQGAINQKLHELALVGKEPFLKALSTRHNNPHQLPAAHFLNFFDKNISTEGKDGEKDRELKNKLALVLSIAKWGDKSHEKIEALLAAVRNFRASTSDISLENLLDILSMIDPKATLPALDELIAIISSAKVTNYSDLYSYLTKHEHLQDCVFDSSLSLDYLTAEVKTVSSDEKKDLFSTWEDSERELLNRIVKTRFPYALLETQRLTVVHKQLTHITMHWPKKLTPLLECLYNPERSQLGKGALDIEFFGELLALLCKYGDQKNSFPLKILDSIISHPRIANVTDRDRLKKSINSILDDTHTTYKQKQKLLDIAITISVKNDPEKIILQIIQCAKKYPLLLDYILMIYDQDVNSFNEALQIFHGLTQLVDQLDKNTAPQVRDNIFSLVKDNQPVYLSTIKAILALPEDKEGEHKEDAVKYNKKAAILAIVAHCCTKELSKDQVKLLILDLAQLDNALLSELVIVCTNKPTPDFAELHIKITDQENLRKWLSTFGTNPDGQRTDKKIKEQFDCQSVPEAIANFVDLNCNDARPLTTMQRSKLHQWFHFVNDLGHNNNRAIYVRKINGKEIKLAAKDLSQKEIRELVKRYRKILSDPNQTPAAKLTARLASVAIAREAMYRATGLFPNSTQILALLNKMMQGAFVESEMKVGFGKTMMTGLEAFMLWVEEEGSTVDVTTLKAVDSARDLKFNKPFFALMGVPVGSECINGQSTSESYCLDGVNYGSMGNLAIYRERMQIEGTWKEPKKLSLVVTEHDAMILDEKVHYRYAANTDTQDGSNQNKFQWIYPHLFRYVKSGAYQTQDLIEYIIENTAGSDEKGDVEKILRTLGHERLDAWIRAAIAASGVKNGMDFVVKSVDVATDDDEEVKKVYAACILMEDGYPSDDARWSYGTHQIVEAGLAAETQCEFRSEPEISAVATMISKAFIEFYRTRGCIWLNGGTIGSSIENHEQQQKYQFKMCRAPVHHKNQRIDRLPVIAATEAKQWEAITQQVISHLRQQHRYWFNRDGKPQPTAIIGKDIQQTEAIYRHLKIQLAGRHELNYRLFVYNGARAVMYTATGVEVEVNPPAGMTLDEYMVSQAGLPGTIMVTNLFARDTNIDARLNDDKNARPHPDGLFVINTFLAAERATQQIIGRTARQGRPGEYLFIGQESDLAGTNAKADIPTRIKQAQERITESSTKGRQLRDRQSDIKSCAFDRLFQLLSSLPTDAKEARREILAAWAKNLDQIENQWLQIEEDTLPDIKAATSVQLEACCDALTNAMCTVWDGFLIQVQKTVTKHGLAFEKDAEQKGDVPSQILNTLALDSEIVKNEITTRRYARSAMMSNYANYSAMLLKETDPQKTYERFNPLALLSDDKVPEQSMKQVVLDFLKAYQSIWFKGSDRTKNVNDLIGQVTALEEKKEDFVNNLLLYINEASNKAMASDWQVDNNFFSFFQRNSNGSRYQATLDEIEKKVIAHAAGNNAEALVRYQLTAIDNRLKRIQERNSKINNANVRALLENNIKLMANDKKSPLEKNTQLIESFDFNPYDIPDRSLRDLMISLRVKCYELQPLVGYSLPPQTCKPFKIDRVGMFAPKAQAPETGDKVAEVTAGMGLG
jgi:preprotein translocase subunit SecA